MKGRNRLITAVVGPLREYFPAGIVEVQLPVGREGRAIAAAGVNCLADGPGLEDRLPVLGMP
jgi:hypothetical protein